MNKVLICYLSFGNGHKAVANYIKNHFDNLKSDFEVETIDFTCFARKKKQFIYINSFYFLQLKFPLLWSVLYYSFNIKHLVSFAFYKSKSIMYNKKLKEYVKKVNPDLVISTHYFASMLINNLKKDKIINPKMITIVTDYDKHMLWQKSSMISDLTIVGCKDTKSFFERKGTKSNKIKNFGIPVLINHNLSPNFHNLFNNNNNKTFLFFAGGGQGSIRSFKYLKKLLKENLNINIIYIAGKSKKIKSKVDKYISKHNYKNIVTYSFYENISDLYIVCDYVITKPGGIQLTESLYYNKPIFMICSGGGQENVNYKYFQKNQYGKYYKNAKRLLMDIKQLLQKEKEFDYFKNIKKQNNNDSIKKLIMYIKKTRLL